MTAPIVSASLKTGTRMEMRSAITCRDTRTDRGVWPRPPIRSWR